MITLVREKIGDLDLVSILNEIVATQKILLSHAENYAKYIASKLGANIARIVLFGSLSKKNSNKNSDIDILIIHFGNVEFENQLAEETFNFMMTSGAPIEYIAYSYFDFKYNPTYFLEYNLKNGVTLFMKNKNELKTKEIQSLIELADEFEIYAREVFELKRTRPVIDLGYNSIELKIKALLLKILKDLPGSHGGLIAKFGELYIVTKKIPQELGRKINKALALRNKARYDPSANLTSDDCETILSLITELSDYLT